VIVILGACWLVAVVAGASLIFINVRRLVTNRSLTFDEKVWKVVGIVFGAWLAIPPLAFGAWLLFQARLRSASTHQEAARPCARWHASVAVFA
jgi:hypothetical protein